MTSSSVGTTCTARHIYLLYVNEDDKQRMGNIKLNFNNLEVYVGNTDVHMINRYHNRQMTNFVCNYQSSFSFAPLPTAYATILIKLISSN